MNRSTSRIRLEGKEVDFELVRKKSVRRNILVRFGEDGRMNVTAPLRASTRDVRLILSGMHDQIVELRRQVREIHRGLAPVRYRQGARHYYLGRTYELDIHRRAGIRPHVILRARHIEVHVGEWGEEAVREALLAWYRRQAQTYCPQRTFQIASRVRWLRGISYQVRLRRMKRSWGTCSAAGVITLNPLLMKAPPQYIDYIIAHELCHLIEHNHSPDFYRLMDRLMPNWDVLRHALNERSHLYLRW
jgi:predicted metal-dependent hydrolase